MSTKTQSPFKKILLVASANFLEMYDFMVYGYYASAIARAFFPASSEYASLMLSFGAFGAGALMRPVGAIVLGGYIDRHGRRAGLILTVGLMAAGIATIAFMPPYAAIGLFAPAMVLLGRLVQGVAAGGVVGGVSVYLAEIATPGNKGFYVSWQSGSQQVAVMFTALLGVGLTSFLSPEAMLEWGWRIPLLIGCLLVPLLFVMRNSLQETEEFEARKTHPSLKQALGTILLHWRIVGLGMMLAMMMTVSFYFVTVYTPTFGEVELHLSARDSMMVTLAVGILNLLILPSSGALSDRIGRRPILITCTLLTLITAYPVLSWLVAAPSFGRLMAAELWLAGVYAAYNGAFIVYLTEIMPPSVRTTGFSLAYALAVGLFGTFTPAISTFLIHETGNPASPGIWLSTAAGLALIGTLLLPGQLRRGHLNISGG